MQADALAWCIYELAKTPQYQEKLREEIELHRGRSNGGQMEYDSMPFLNAFLKEILRYYPAAPYMEREASEDCDSGSSRIGDYDDIWGGISHLPVKKGQFISVAVASYQRCVRLQIRGYGMLIGSWSHF